MYLAQKVLIGDAISYVSYWRGERHFTWSSEPRDGLPVCRVKAVPSFLSYFKILNISLAPGIKPTASRSAVKHSTDTELILPQVGFRTFPMWLLQLLNFLGVQHGDYTSRLINPPKKMPVIYTSRICLNTFVGFGSTQDQGCR